MLASDSSCGFLEWLNSLETEVLSPYSQLFLSARGTWHFGASPRLSSAQKTWGKNNLHANKWANENRSSFFGLLLPHIDLSWGWAETLRAHGSALIWLLKNWEGGQTQEHSMLCFQHSIMLPLATPQPSHKSKAHSYCWSLTHGSFLQIAPISLQGRHAYSLGHRCNHSKSLSETEKIYMPRTVVFNMWV